MATALVTGPTSGIGYGFAEALAQRGFDLILVARNAERLADVAAELERTHRISCEAMAADLAIRDDLARVERRLGDEERPVDLLVNNAGLGLGQSLLRSSADDEQHLLNVLCTAVLRLTKAVLPAMTARRTGVIVNVSSFAGFVPYGSYGAAKAWVTSFTEGLAGELVGSGVGAYVCCPGFVRTDFHQRADISTRSFPGPSWIDVGSVVQETLRRVDRGARTSVSPVVVPTRRYRAVAVLAKLAPRGLVAFIARQTRMTR